MATKVGPHNFACALTTIFIGKHVLHVMLSSVNLTQDFRNIFLQQIGVGQGGTISTPFAPISLGSKRRVGGRLALAGQGRVAQLTVIGHAVLAWGFCPTPVVEAARSGRQFRARSARCCAADKCRLSSRLPFRRGLAL